MRLLPDCSEGFRRLALVLAIVAGLAGAAYTVFAFGQAASARSVACVQTYQVEEAHCLDKGCHYFAQDAEDRCLAASQVTVRERAETWFVALLLGLVSAYVAALVTRTVGWVVQGFSVNARQPSI